MANCINKAGVQPKLRSFPAYFFPDFFFVNKVSIWVEVFAPAEQTKYAQQARKKKNFPTRSHHFSKVSDANTGGKEHSINLHIYHPKKPEKENHSAQGSPTNRVYTQGHSFGKVSPASLVFIIQ